MKRLLGFSLIVVLLASYCTYALLQPSKLIEPTVTFHFARSATSVQLAWPQYGTAAVGAIGYGILETHGVTAPLPTASTIKVLTALSVLARYPLNVGEQGPTIAITQADVDSYDRFVSVNGSTVRVARGEQLSEYQALEAMLIPSANNMAETLARWAFGSIKAFNAYANSYAVELGMTSTTVTDPSGFDPSTVSTPHDLVLLGETAIQDPVVAGIVRQTSATIPVAGLVHNYNTLLGRRGIIGIKTGNSDQDAGCYLFAATSAVDGTLLTIVGAVMGGPSLGKTMHDSLPLLASTVNGFASVHVADKNTRAATYSAPWQHTVRAVTSQTAQIVAWQDSTTSITMQANSLAAPSRNGAFVGSMIIHNSKQQHDTTIPLIISGSVSTPNIWWQLAHPR